MLLISVLHKHFVTSGITELMQNLGENILIMMHVEEIPCCKYEYVTETEVFLSSYTRKLHPRTGDEGLEGE